MQSQSRSEAQMFIAEIRSKAGSLLFHGQPQETREEAARYAFRNGPQNAKVASTSLAYRDPSGNWRSAGSDIRWIKRHEVWRDPPAACDVGLFSDNAKQVDLEDLL